MTDNKPSAANGRASEVLDPEWEDALRRGQEEEGERGSVEPELAMVHLLRHARAPETLAAEDLDAIWADIEAEVAPAGVVWWRKAWVWWTAPVLATAAIVAVIVIQPGAEDASTVARQDQPAPSQDAADATRERKAEDAEAEVEEEAHSGAGKIGEGTSAPMAAAESAADGPAGGDGATRGGGLSSFESSYIQLEPHGRAALLVAVDQSRDELRDQLLAQARGGGR